MKHVIMAIFIHEAPAGVHQGSLGGCIRIQRTLEQMYGRGKVRFTIACLTVAAHTINKGTSHA